MRLSPLQLKHYHYKRLLLETSRDFKPTDASQRAGAYWVADASKIATKIVLGVPDEIIEGDEPFFILELSIKYKESAFPYFFEIDLLGVVSCSESENESKENFQHRLVANTASLLYSAAREQILMLTSRHQPGPMMLPSLDFRNLQTVS